MKTILIFGTGFIAAHLIEHYHTYHPRYRLIVLYNKHQIQTPHHVAQYSMDDDIPALLQKEKPDYIVCLHGNSMVTANTEITDAVNMNVLKTTDFLNKIYTTRHHSFVKKILIIGSASEYGKLYNEPIREDFPLHPTSIYGLSKIFLYNAAMYYKERGLPVVYVRQFNTIGLGQRESFVLPTFCKQVVLIEKNLMSPEIHVGDLTQERDFIDVRDTCRAYDLLLEKGDIGKAYNVASGNYITIKNLLDTVIAKSRCSADTLTISSNEALFAKEDSLSKRLHADISQITRLGFTPYHSLDETVEAVIDDWRKNV